MNCPRCGGLAVREYNIHLPVGSPFGFQEWRCVNCGMISDDVISNNQRTPPPLKLSRPQGPRQYPQRAPASSFRR
jgi:C4-type Zn-finger protein